VVGLVLVVGIAAVTFPLWASGMFRDALTRRLARRTELSAHIDDVNLGYGDAVLGKIRIGEAGGPARVVLENVRVDLDGSALWRARIDADAVQVQSGRVDGTSKGLRDLWARLMPAKKGAGREPGSSRVRLMPGRVDIDALRVSVRDTDPDGKERRVSAWIEIDARPRERQATVVLRQVHADLGQLPGLHASRMRAELRAEPGEDGELQPVFPLPVDVEGVAATITPEIAVAGVQGRIVVADRELSQFEVDLSGGFSDEASPQGSVERLWSLSGRVRRDLTEGALDLEMEAFELGRVPEVLARLPVVDSEEATVGGNVSLEFGEGRAHIEGDVALAGVNVRHDLLARQVVRDVGFDLEFEAELDPSRSHLEVQRARFHRKGVVLEVDGALTHPPQREGRSYRVHARMPPLECQKVLDAIPAELVPSLQGFALDGDFDLDLSADIDFANLDDLSIGGRVGIWSCIVRRVPARVSAARLASGFTHRVTMRDGRERMVRLAPGSGSFSSLSQISPHMVAAVLTTEDGGFYSHRGFLPQQLEEALRRNLKAGRVRLGASTISMQMVKNVLLSHERTLSRKLQEMFLTWTVERSLTKDRIMEIYLNVVELAPGIYGVTQASQHYFGKHPKELNPLEAAYLALMLPSPVRRHAHYCRGEISERFDIKLRRILRIMHGRKRISDDEYEQWKEGEIVFDLRERESEEDCLAEIRQLAAAAGKQRALSGLLSGRGSTAPAEDMPTGPVEVMIPDHLPSLDELDPAEADAPGIPAMETGAPPADDETW
jgi:hypothetical protein